MARTQNLFLKLIVLLLALAFPYVNADAYEKNPETYPTPTPRPYAPPKQETNVVIEGIVYCQSCNYSGTWNLDNAEPIVGAKISAICRNYKGRITYYKVYTTSEGGYFYVQLDGFAMRHPILDHPLQSCAVKLVSSPLDKCDVYTNINYGVKGSPLRYENKKIMTDNYKAVIYAAGPLAFRPDHCDPSQY